MPADYVAALLAKRREADAPSQSQSLKLPAKIYGVMIVTALLTFVSLVQTYERFFTYQLYA